MWNRRFERILDGIKDQELTQIIITENRLIEFITGMDTKNEEIALLITFIGKIIIAIKDGSSIEIPEDIYAEYVVEGESIISALAPFLSSGNTGVEKNVPSERFKELTRKRYDTWIESFHDVANINYIFDDEFGKTEEQLIIEKTSK